MTLIHDLITSELKKTLCMIQLYFNMYAIIICTKYTAFNFFNLLSFSSFVMGFYYFVFFKY